MEEVRELEIEGVEKLKTEEVQELGRRIGGEKIRLYDNNYSYNLEVRPIVIFQLCN